MRQPRTVPQPLAYRRRYPLDPARFQYLEGCVRGEGRYEVPRFALCDDRPLLYVSFGSLGAADVDLYERLIALLGRLPYRALVSVGDYLSAYTGLPGNVRVEAFFPQPAVRRSRPCSPTRPCMTASAAWAPTCGPPTAGRRRRG